MPLPDGSPADESVAADPRLLSTTIYHSLHELAARQLREQAAPSLQPTALVHEAWMRIANLPAFRGTLRAQFFALAGKAMRSVLVDHARRRSALKRDVQRRIEFDPDQIGIDTTPNAEILALDEALQKLEQVDPELVRVVDLIYFCGKSPDEVGELLGVSGRTITRRWRLARAWLREELGGDDASTTNVP